jgi:hypothetical protein
VHVRPVGNVAADLVERLAGLLFIGVTLSELLAFPVDEPYVDGQLALNDRSPARRVNSTRLICGGSWRRSTIGYQHTARRNV